MTKPDYPGMRVVRLARRLRVALAVVRGRSSRLEVIARSGDDVYRACRRTPGASPVGPSRKIDPPTHPDESGTPRTGDPYGTFGTNRGVVRGLRDEGGSATP